MSADKGLFQEIAAYKWKFTMTTARKILILLAGLGVVCMLYRLATGLGSATNLNDQWPWGLWIGFDVLTGVALAGGGYGTAIIVHVLHRNKYLAIARSAMLTSLLGYLLVMAGLFMDIGQWFNFWRPFVSWGHTSVLFEVFWCVSCYTTVQVLEFGEIVTEKVGTKYHNFFKKALPVLMVLGIIFPTLHQSSLGALYVIMVDKLYPLWWSPYIGLMFLMSSFFVGPAMICVETALAGKAFKHEVPISVLRGLVRIAGVFMILYLGLKFYDLAARGVVNLIFAGNLEGNMFMAEIILGVMIPVYIAFSSMSNTRKGLITFGILVSGGLIFNRMNVVFTGMSAALGGWYFPSIMEWAVSIGLISIGCLVYCFIAENFNILVHEDHQGAST
ncbi:NrfD/PsrC family molybdoenzyme membrane anchor subunit [Desulforamulus aeronauticus]|uniref:Ni/Fe-hydrogenase 2 integral membrane subunit HybB n=1 Tax=Desulforamulus aeronauticus DSM 10349 TaxID=1121421 RepID=A0A1M6PN97_9FIRM|nr:NrfD/PsrC family molybdoenzyme membrane anchor subunit [Desulforamulus aeronauticus]SHK09439.1 Ni/Fe-hydrogenase 2 integral membrane subunit HybB [Desulforamulus aeronauticus DSM 10349]